MSVFMHIIWIKNAAMWIFLDMALAFIIIARIHNSIPIFIVSDNSNCFSLINTCPLTWFMGHSWCGIGYHPSAIGDQNHFYFLFVKMKYRSVHFTIVFDNLLSKKNNYCVVYERESALLFPIGDLGIDVLQKRSYP